MITISPVVIDVIKLDLFAPGKVTVERELVRTHDGATPDYELTVRDPVTGGEIDLTNLSTATVTFKRGTTDTIDKTPTVSGSVLSGSITTTETTVGEGEWSVYATLTFTDGDVLVTGERKCFYLDIDYTTSTVIKRTRPLPRIDTSADEVDVLVSPISHATGKAPDMTGITVARLLVQSAGGTGVAAIEVGSLNGDGTASFAIPASKLSASGQIYTAVLSLAGASRAIVAQKQEYYLVTDASA